MDAERLFLENLALIDRLVAATCRRSRMSREETEDFGSALKLKLIANDYAVLRSWAGRSSLPGYLAAVVQRALLDHRNHLWGKWRPCAEARRLGPLAIRLDTLLHRDGLTLDEALAGARAEDRAEMLRLAPRLPARARRRVDGDESLEELPAPAGSPEVDLLEREREAARERLEAALEQAMGELSPEDRVLLQLRLQEGVTVVSVARALGRDVKQMYRRLETVLRQLRTTLERGGLDATQVAWAFDSGPTSPAIEEERAARPSQEAGRSR